MRFSKGGGSKAQERKPNWIRGGDFLDGDCWTKGFTNLTFYELEQLFLAVAFLDLLERTSVHSFSCSSSQMRFSRSQYGVPLFQRWKYTSKVEQITPRSFVHMKTNLFREDRKPKMVVAQELNMEIHSTPPQTRLKAREIESSVNRNR